MSSTVIRSICRPCAEMLYSSRLRLLQQRRRIQNNRLTCITSNQQLQYHSIASFKSFGTTLEQSLRKTNGASSRPPVKHAKSYPLRQTRTYYSADHATQPPYPPDETAILSTSLGHVPKHGFTTAALTLGASDAGYLPASLNLLPHGGPYDLVLYHLVTSRLALKDTVQFPAEGTSQLSIHDKLRTLILARLRANEPYVQHLPAALALLTQPTKLPTSLNELALLADEIVYLSGDVVVDTRWYTRRGGVMGIYAAAEVFMCQDSSTGFRETEQFVDRRLEEANTVGGAVDNIGEWLGYSAWSAVNVARSWGARI